MWIVLNPSLPKHFHILLKQTALLVPKKAVSLLDLQLGTDSWQKNGSPTSPAMPNKHHYMPTSLHKPEHSRRQDLSSRDSGNKDGHCSAWGPGEKQSQSQTLRTQSRVGERSLQSSALSRWRKTKPTFSFVGFPNSLKTCSSRLVIIH